MTITFSMNGSIWRIVKPSLVGRGDQRELFSEPEFGRGAWVGGGAKPCKNCGAPLRRARRGKSLPLEWRTWDPLRFGDFTWPAGTYFPLAAPELAAELTSRFTGFVQAPVLPRPERIRSDNKPGRRLAAKFLERASRLTELRVVRECPPDAERSTLRLIRPPCRGCGLHRVFWGGGFEILARGKAGLTVLEGVEWWESGIWDSEARCIPKWQHAREPGRGLYVSRAELGGAGVFRIPDSHALLCTDELRDFVERRGCTNVAFMAAGELVA